MKRRRDRYGHHGWPRVRDWRRASRTLNGLAFVVMLIVAAWLVAGLILSALCGQ